MSDPINPRFLRIHREPKPTLEEGEVLPPEPIPFTQAAFNRTNLAISLVEDATWTSCGLPHAKKTRLLCHHHIIERHNIIFATVALFAQGASLIVGSTKLVTPADRSFYLARAIGKLVRLQNSSRK
jgi:hypothetical protein